jgi:hypothetical protein
VRRPSFAHLALIYVAVLSGLLAAAGGVAWFTRQPYPAALLTSGGVFLLAGAYWKPWWFWDYHEAFLLRWLVGDRATTAIYGGLGAALLWLGLLATGSFGP